jgi:hypothetical protein
VAKNRIIYNTQALFVSSVPATGMQINTGDILQLSRVQNFDEDFTRNFTDINQYGNLGAMDRVEIENPDVTANFSYFLTNGQNEKNIGLNVYQQGTDYNNLLSCLSGILTKTTDEKNYYLLVTEEGSDAAGYAGSKSGVIGIGNGFLTSYSVNAAVGAIPTADVEIEGLNINVYGNLNNNSEAWDFEQFLSGDFANSDFGRSVACNYNGDILVIGGATDSQGISNGGAGWVYTGNKNNGWKLKQKITGSVNNGRLSRNAVNQSGNIIVLGAFGYYNFSGAALIYTGNAVNGWTFKQDLKGVGLIDLPAGFGGLSEHWFGRITKINNSGNVIVVGAQRDNQGGLRAGSLQVFTGNGINNWSHAQTLTGMRPSGGLTRGAINGSGNIIVGGGFSNAVGIPSSNIPDPENFAIIYTGDPMLGRWSEKQKISGNFLQLYKNGFGISTDISEDGSVIVVGAPYETQGIGTGFYGDNPNYAAYGAAYIFTGNSNNGWILKEKKVGTISNEAFGWNVSISANSNVITIGSPGTPPFLANNIAKSYTTIYTGNAIDGWVFKQKVAEDNNSSQFGTYIDSSFDGSNIFIGGATYLSTRGATIIYTLESGSIVPAINTTDGSILNNTLFRLPQASSSTGANIPTALNPGDIIFSLKNNDVLGFEGADLKVQDFTLSLDLPRTPIQKIGNRFAFSREIDFPVIASIEVNAEVGDLSGGNLANLICSETEKEFTILMKKPGCGANKETAMAYICKGAKLVSQSFSSAIGDNATMSATYEVQLGGPQDTNKGIFISGSFQNFNAVLLEGAGAYFSDGIYKYAGMSNGKPFYGGVTNDANYISYQFTEEGFRWGAFNEDVGEVAYMSDNDVFYPWEAQWYSVSSSYDPPPTFTPINI